MQIRDVDQYREAVNEVRRLDGAAEGSAAFERRQDLLAAMAAFEQDCDRPGQTPGKPAPFSVQPKR